MISILLLIIIFGAALFVAKNERYTKYAFYLTLLIFAAFVARNIFRPALHSSHGPIYLNQELSWDFRAYYYAAKAYLIGLNPYNPENLTKLRGGEVLPFMYSPTAIYAFIPLSYLDYPMSLMVFIIGKILALVLLLLIWNFLFLKSDYARIFLLTICISGFNETIWSDFYNGNISLYEQFVLWAGIYLLSRERIVLYCLAVLIVSLFKFLTIFFLLVPLALWFNKKVSKIIVCFFGIFILINVVTYLSLPNIYSSFLSSAFGALQVGGFGVHDFGAPSLIRTFVIPVLKEFGLAFKYLDFVLYAALITLVSALSYAILTSHQFKTMPLLVVIYCLFLYACITPRALDYFFILLIFPSVLAIQIMAKPGLTQILLFSLIIFNFGLYQPILVTLGIFVLLATSLLMSIRDRTRLGILSNRYYKIVGREWRQSSNRQ
jgi:hypothetical protein